MANPREKNLYMAKVAEQAERYEEMVESMEKVTTAASAEGNNLTDEERHGLSLAYKNKINTRRAAWRVVCSIEKMEERLVDEDHVAAIRDFRAKIESELSSICDGILRLLDDHLLPYASAADSKVFYLKMKGDYYRYLAEFKNGTDRVEATDSALAAYESAQEIAEAELAPEHHLRLGLALNFSVFYYEIMRLPIQARDLAQQAYDDADGNIENLEEEHFRLCSLIMQIFRDNLTIWNFHIQNGSTDNGKATTHQ